MTFNFVAAACYVSRSWVNSKMSTYSWSSDQFASRTMGLWSCGMTVFPVSSSWSKEGLCWML